MRTLLIALATACAACSPSAPPLPSTSWAPGVQDQPLPSSSGAPLHARSEYLTLWHGVAAEQLKLRSQGLLGDSRDAVLVTAPAQIEQAFAPSEHPRVLQSAVRRAASRPQSTVIAEVFWRSPAGEIRSLQRVQLDTPAEQVSEAWHDIRVELPQSAGDLVFITREAVGASQSNGTELAWQAPVVAPVRHGSDSRPPDVLLITVDTLRSDAIVQAPQLKALLQTGAFWPRAVSPSNWTLPSYASLFSGLDADQHQAGRGPFAAQPSSAAEDRQLSAINPQLPLLAQSFREAGYATAMVHQNPMLETWTGLDAGFERYARAGDQTAHVLEIGSAWWQDNSHRPRMLVLHFMAPHLPYSSGAGPNPLDQLELVNFFGEDHSYAARAEFFALTEAQREQVRARYQAGVSELDQQLAPWIKRQLEQSLPLLVGFHSDHGEELWDAGNFEHGHSFDDSVIRVPLGVFSNQPSTFPELTVGQFDTAVPAHRLGATLCELAGVEHPYPAGLFRADAALAMSRSLMPLYRALASGREIGLNTDGLLPFDPSWGSGGNGAPISEAKLKMLAELGYLARQHQR